MSEETQEPTEAEIENTYQNIMKGLELSVTQLQAKLDDQVDGLSTKELRRALKAVVNYPATPTNLTAANKREQEVIAGLFSLHQMQVQLEIQVIGELQKERESENE